MRVNYKKMQNKNLLIHTSGNKPKNDCDLVELLGECVKQLKNAQGKRNVSGQLNTLGELWAVEALSEVLDCFEIKKIEEC